MAEINALNLNFNNGIIPFNKYMHVYIYICMYVYMFIYIYIE